MEIKQANSIEQFQEDAKEYVINMYNNSRKLHKKNCCRNSEFLLKYYDFDTLEEAENSSITFDKCKNCFSDKTKNSSTANRNTNTILVEKVNTRISKSAIINIVTACIGIPGAVFMASIIPWISLYFVAIMLIVFIITAKSKNKPLTLYSKKLVGYAINIHQEKTIPLSDIAYLEKNYKHNGMKTLTVTTKSNEFFTFTEVGNIDEFCDKIAELRKNDNKFRGTFVYPRIFSKEKKGTAIAIIIAFIALIIILVSIFSNYEPPKHYTKQEKENQRWAAEAQDYINEQYY